MKTSVIALSALAAVASAQDLSSLPQCAVSFYPSLIDSYSHD